MAEYKLTYFNARGLTEPIRYIFAFAEVQYEDIRIEKDSWPNLKNTTPWGQLPVLEIAGVGTLAQSSAIARYLARKYNLTGKSELDAARCDELVDAVGDLKGEWRKYFVESDEEKKAELKKSLLNVFVPKYLGKFENIIETNPSGKKRLVSGDFTWADFYVSCSLEALEKSVDGNVLNDYPNLKALKEEVNEEPRIKKWISERPETAN